MVQNNPKWPYRVKNNICNSFGTVCDHFWPFLTIFDHFQNLKNEQGNVYRAIFFRYIDYQKSSQVHWLPKVLPGTTITRPLIIFIVPRRIFGNFVPRTIFGNVNVYPGGWIILIIIMHPPGYVIISSKAYPGGYAKIWITYPGGFSRSYR